MKTNTLKTTLRLWTSYLGSAAATLMLVTACGSNGGGGTAAVVGYGGYGIANCSSCAGGTSFITNGVADDPSLGAELGLYFYGSAQVLAQTQQAQAAYGQSIPYKGPTAASGFLYAAAGIPQCGIPAGVYQLQTTTPGAFGADGAGRSFDQIIMSGSNLPVQVAVSGYTVPSAPASVGRDGNSYPNRMVVTTFALAVNGQVCANLNLQFQ